MGRMGTPATWRDWAAVATLGLGVFTITTTEIMPIGLLAPMADDLDVSEGMIGLTVTFFAAVAAIASPTLATATRRLDRRVILLTVLAMFAVGNALTALAGNYVLLVAVRAVIGCALGLMWAIVAATAVLLVPASASVRATTIAFSGVSIASVAGMPLGTFVGQSLGWRAAYWGLAGLSAIAFVALAVFMRPTAPVGSVSLRKLPAVLRNRVLASTLGVTALVIIGAYAAYTYVTPFIVDSIGIDDDLVSAVLLAMGAAGVAGNFAAGAFMTRATSLRWALTGLVGSLAGALALVLITAPIAASAIVMLLAWAAAYAAIPVGLQTTVFRAAPQAREAATTLYATTFNSSIAIGALVGAIAIDRGGPSTPIAVGALCCVAAALLTITLPVRRPATH